MLGLEGLALGLRRALRVLTSAAADINFACNALAILAVVNAVRNAALDSVDSLVIHN